MKKLEFIGKDVMRRNWEQVRALVRAQYPSLSDTSIDHIANDMMRATKGPDGDSIDASPRTDRTNLVAWGRDVFTANPETMPAWSYLTPMQREVVRKGQCRFYPSGLSQTYVWCKENGFVQEVTDADLKLFREAVLIRGWFRDPDEHGPFKPVRTFDYDVIEEHDFTDAEEAKRYERDVQRKKQWSGV